MPVCLPAMKPKHDYLICVDSDGCVFDSMELKHKECFCPATVNVWSLQNVSRFAREAAEFVNLYSRTRGINRFPALVRTLKLTAQRPEVLKRGYVLPDLKPLEDWIAFTPSLSGAALEALVGKSADPDPALLRALQWSHEVDQNVARIVHGMRPFPYVKEALERLRTFADIVVVSVTPHETLLREWADCGLDGYVSAIAGQEMGTKAQCIRQAMQGRYRPDHVLKIGDAPGDYAAAKANGVLFNPILAGEETACWQRILDESAARFQYGSYRGAYMQGLTEAFSASLLENPPWEKG